MVNNKKPISIRFSDEELIIVKNNASLANQSISQFIRQKVLNENNSPPQKNENNFNLIKAISICAGFAETFVKHRFNDEEYNDFQQKVKKILEINSINSNQNS